MGDCEINISGRSVSLEIIKKGNQLIICKIDLLTLEELHCSLSSLWWSVRVYALGLHKNAFCYRRIEVVKRPLDTIHCSGTNVGASLLAGTGCLHGTQGWLFALRTWSRCWSTCAWGDERGSGRSLSKQWWERDSGRRCLRRRRRWCFCGIFDKIIIEISTIFVGIIAWDWVL